MFEKFKEQRRIYKLVKSMKNKFEVEKHSCFYYKFSYNDISVKYIYSVYVNDCQITGWYGLKLKWMLRRMIHKREQQEDLNQLKSIGIKNKIDN